MKGDSVMIKRTENLFLLALILVSCAFSLSSQAEDKPAAPAAAVTETGFKIGYVDIQKAIQATSAGKKAKTELQAEFEKRKKELETVEKDLVKMRDDFEKKKDLLSEQVRQEKAVALQTEFGKYQEKMAKHQHEIQTKERELTGPILEKIKKAIADLAASGGYTMILEKAEQSVLWAKKEIDLTDPVVNAVEKMKK